MNIFNRLSIKWKLTFALIGTGLVLILSYVVLAKKIFEEDKIAYVYESQNYKVQTLSAEFSRSVKENIDTARALLQKKHSSGEDANSVKSKNSIANEKYLLAIELSDLATDESLVKIEKTSGLLNKIKDEFHVDESDRIKFFALDSERMLLKLNYSLADNKIYQLKVMASMPNIFKEQDPEKIIVLLQRDQVVYASNSEIDFKSLFLSLNKNIDLQTLRWAASPQVFLVSAVKTGIDDLVVLSMIPESHALGALNILFSQSVIFLIISLLILTVVALILSRSLTTNLSLLTKAARGIGQGQLDQVPQIHTHDEMGILSRTMTLMTQQIQRLLDETKDKARMEQELLTAKYVQERLMPKEPEFSLNQIELVGSIMTSSECGGDWWYYFNHQHMLYIAIADATGHGTPSALLTAGARAVFSRLQNENLSLAKMMSAWDCAVQACSGGKVFMTALLVQINTITGECEALSASHEPPFYLTWSESGEGCCDTIDLELNPTLGEGYAETCLPTKFQLGPEESLVLYTDGLFSVQNEGAKSLSERRLSQYFKKNMLTLDSARLLHKTTLDLFHQYRNDQPLPDDVSVIAIRNTKKRSTK